MGACHRLCRIEAVLTMIVLVSAAMRTMIAILVVGLGLAEHLHDAGQQSISTCTHVDGPGGQPDGVDPDHRSSSRTQDAQAPARPGGQRMMIVVGPRVSSMWMSDSPGAAGGVGK